MDQVLVTYASRSGATRGVAEAIGKTLAENGVSVSVMPMNDVKDLSGYQMLIAGSAIQGGSWLPEALDIMERHKSVIIQKKLATFLVCMTLAMPGGEKYRDHISSWMEPVRKYGKPLEEGIFSGVLEVNKLPSFRDRMKFKISVAMGVWKEGDHRDWNAIHSWAKSLLRYLG